MRSRQPPELDGRQVGCFRCPPVVACAGFLIALLVSACALQSQATAQSPVPRSEGQVRLSFAPVVKETASAIVSVITTKKVAVAGNPFNDDPFFKYFFRDFGDPAEEEHEQRSLGSGVIVSASGLVVTNHHVVEGADEISVVLNDRRELDAELVISDERSDLAFLRVDVEGIELPSIPFGDSDRIEVGDLVLAIGNPFGIGQTVTSGIISANARATPDGNSDVSFIQTDAAINPGNSGGALVSIDGELIGINTAMFTRSGGSVGIGFAIPVNLVRARIMALEQGGEFVRPWLGTSLQTVDTELASALGIDRPRGVLINRIHPQSTAARAGLTKGDVILAVDGVEISDEPALRLRLALKPIGEPVELGIWQERGLVNVRMNLESAPREPAPDVTELRGRHPLTGATVANMSPGFNEESGLDMFESGIVVLAVDPRSFANRLRLRKGDEIESVNQAVPGTVDELETLLGQGGETWQIDIRRGQKVFTLSVS